MSDETIYAHGDTRIDVGALTGDLRVFDKGDLMAVIEDGGYTEEAIRHLRAEVERLQDELFRRGAMKNAPCFCCGYNGPGYFQPGTHPCAARHHAAMAKVDGKHELAKKATEHLNMALTQQTRKLMEHIEKLKEINAKHVLNRIDIEGRLSEYESGFGFFITAEKIDAAWGWYHDDCHRGMHSYMDNHFVFLNTVAFLGIVACKECGGSGKVKTVDIIDGSGSYASDCFGFGFPEWSTCHRCQGHGWIRDERGDE